MGGKKSGCYLIHLKCDSLCEVKILTCEEKLCSFNIYDCTQKRKQSYYVDTKVSDTSILMMVFCFQSIDTVKHVKMACV